MAAPARVRARPLGAAEARSLGIGPPLLLTWVLCSGVPILMVALIPVGREVTDPKDLIAPIWFAAGAAIGAGFIARKLATQAVTLPTRIAPPVSPRAGRTLAPAGPAARAPGLPAR